MHDDFRQYHAIWALDVGAVLLAKRTLHMEDSGERVFTEGTHYPVISIHPVADPPFVKVRDESGRENIIQPDFLKHFERVFEHR